MRNKSILYVGGFVLPDKNAAANRVVSNGKAFQALGHKTYFLGAAPDDEVFDEIRKTDGFENMFEQAHPQSSTQWIKHMFSTQNIESLVDTIGNIGTVILYNVPFFTLLKAKKAFKKKDIKVCYDCTEWSSYTEGALLKRVFKKFDEFLIRNFAHKVADKMIVISSLMANKYKKAQPIVVPPLVDINDSIWHQSYTKDADVFEFCFAGVPGGNKESLDMVVDAFCSLKRNGTRLRIVGITEEEFKKIYPDCVIEDRFRSQIVFMGMLSHEEAVKYVLGCDCCIFIRCSDRRNNAGFPTKFAESFTCNVPIITTNVSDIGKYIKKYGKGCLLDEMTVSSIAKAMLSQIEKTTVKDKSLNRVFHYEAFKDIFLNWLEK